MALRLIPAIHRATHRIGLYLAQADAGGVTQGEAHILAHLAEHDGSTIAELHEGLAHSRSTLTSILDRLDERGFITRETSEQDRRSFVVRLTRSGRAVATRVHRHLEDLESAVLDRVPKKDVAALLALLAGVADQSAAAAAPARRGK